MQGWERAINTLSVRRPQPHNTNREYFEYYLWKHHNQLMGVCKSFQNKLFTHNDLFQQNKVSV